jgi:hypothetical protein
MTEVVEGLWYLCVLCPDCQTVTAISPNLRGPVAPRGVYGGRPITCPCGQSILPETENVVVRYARRVGGTLQLVPVSSDRPH